MCIKDLEVPCAPGLSQKEGGRIMMIDDLSRKQKEPTEFAWWEGWPGGKEKHDDCIWKTLVCRCEALMQGRDEQDLHSRRCI